MQAQSEPTIASLAQYQFGEWALATMRYHVHRTGGNLETVVVMLGESASGEGHPLVHRDVVLLGLCEAGCGSQPADSSTDDNRLRLLAHRDTSGVDEGPSRAPQQTSQAVGAVLIDDLTQPLDDQRIVLARHQAVRAADTEFVDDL